MRGPVQQRGLELPGHCLQVNNNRKKTHVNGDISDHGDNADHLQEPAGGRYTFMLI